MKDVQGRDVQRYSPPPGTLPSYDRVSQGVTASSVGQSMSVTGGGGTFIPVEDDVSTFCLQYIDLLIVVC